MLASLADVSAVEAQDSPSPEGTVAPAAPAGGTCIEPTGATSSSNYAYIRRNFLNQWQCKIPLRQGLHSAVYGYDHIYRRGLEKIAQGKTNNHEVTAYAQDLWGYAIARVGGSLQPGSDAYFFASSIKYTTPGGSKRTMCVFYDTKNYSSGGVSYKVKGIITAYWITNYSSNPTSDCINAKGTSD